MVSILTSLMPEARVQNHDGKENFHFHFWQPVYQEISTL